MAIANTWRSGASSTCRCSRLAPWSWRGPTTRLDRLDEIETQARANGVGDVRRLGPSEVLAREPYLAPTVRGALLVPGEHVIDPWSAPLAYLSQAVMNGAVALFGAEVESGRLEGALWRLATRRGEVLGRAVVNCAGLFGDVVRSGCSARADFTIKPRKGEFVVFDKAAARLLRTIVPAGADRAHEGRRPGPHHLWQSAGRPDRRGAGRPPARHRRATRWKR